MSGHGHEDAMEYGDMSYEDGGDGNEDKRMSGLQIFMQRSIAGWPLYTIIISLGQLLSAVSHSFLGSSDSLPGAKLIVISIDFFPTYALDWL